MQRLQREIANERGINLDHLAPSPVQAGPNDEFGFGDVDDHPTRPVSDRRDPPGRVGKRKYRRHPKPDEHAPERPPSAYVIFSNKVREDLKSQNLSFTDIAKRVGEQWQLLGAEEKEPYETQALSGKERYTAELNQYKRTSKYKGYSEYLAEFKAKTAANNTDPKRAKLETTLGHGSGAYTEGRNPRSNGVTASQRRRGNSSGSGRASPLASVPLAQKGTASSTSPAPLSPSLFPPQLSPASSHSASLVSGRPPFDGTSYWPSHTSTAPQLPRIALLDDSDSMVTEATLAPVVTDLSTGRGPNPPQSNPRRSSALPASSSRPDTVSSISSRSSDFSGGTTSSFSPISPTEDIRQPRALPPLTSNVNKGSSTSYAADHARLLAFPSSLSQTQQAYTRTPPLSNKLDTSTSAGRYSSTNQCAHPGHQ
ncbi:hypothetical protein MMC19_007002 [Ptychographa xylographoides]|nr:hypothetical protein [Ptychographa xylographoides]